VAKRSVRALHRRAAVAAADIYGAVTGGVGSELFAHGGLFAQGRAFAHDGVFAHGSVFVQASVGFWAGADASGADPPCATSGGCSAAVEPEVAFGSGALCADDAPSPLAWA
jgi:hypothetical protein